MVEGFLATTTYSIESSHPYTGNLQKYFNISYPGAVGYYVQFDKNCSTVSGDKDYVSIYKNSQHSTFWGSPYYSGPVGSGAWNPTNTLTIYNSSFIVYFRTDSSGSSWGFKLYYTPILGESPPMQELLLIGSPHNYWASIDVYTTVAVPGAIGYYVSFDARSSTVSGDQDYVTLFQDSTHSSYWGSPYYAGYPWSNAWSPNNNLTIYASSFVIRFHSDSSGGSWGYLLKIYPIRVGNSIPVQDLLIIGSPHKYWSSIDVYSTVAVPGAIGYYVSFDNQSSTVSGDVDYLNIFHDKSLSNYWGSPYFSGPGSSGAWNVGNTLTIYNSSFVIHFHTDSSGGDYGFRMFVYPIPSGETIPIQELLVLDSPHNYWGSMNFYSTIAIPGAVGYYIRFDNRSATESSYPDYLNIFQDSSHSTYWGSPFYGGSAGSGAWPSDNYLTIFASSFVIHFASDSSGSAYGFKMLVTPIGDGLLSQELLEIGSPHNYWGNMNFYTTVAIPNAVAYSVWFDRLSYTESGSPDYLSIYQDSTYSTFWGSPYYGGAAGSGAWNPDYNLTIYAATFVLHFKTDSSSNFWGFKMYIHPHFTSADTPVQTLLLVGSPHYYWSSMTFYTTIAIPNSAGYYVRFDNRSCTEKTYDYVSFYTNPLLLSHYGNASYSGCSSNYFNRFEPFYISASSFGVYFHSDSSSNFWGFMLDVEPVFNLTTSNVTCPVNSTLYSSVDNTLCLCNRGHSSSFQAASIADRYSFEEDSADDSVGDLNGRFVSGAYDLSDAAAILYSSSTSTVKPCVNISGMLDFSGSISFESWISTGNTNTGAARVFQFGQTFSSNSYSVALGRNSQTGVLSASLYSSGTTVYTASSTVVFNGLSNAYVATVFSSGIAGTAISIYVNGVLVGSGSTTASLPRITAGGYLGRSFSSSDPGSSIIIDEFRIWAGTLSSADVALSYQTGPSILPCSPCSKTTYSNTVGANQCLSCPAFSTAPTVSSYSCACNAGYNSTGYATNLTCNACPSGYFSHYGDKDCSICLRGTYSLSSATNCSLTPAGYYSSEGSSTYYPCPSGTYSASGAGNCSSCPEGSFSSDASSTCTCYSGYSQSGSGSTLTCTICPAKTYSSGAGSALCINCPPGTSSTGGYT